MLHVIAVRKVSSNTALEDAPRITECRGDLFMWLMLVVSDNAAAIFQLQYATYLPPPIRTSFSDARCKRHHLPIEFRERYTAIRNEELFFFDIVAMIPKSWSRWHNEADPSGVEVLFCNHVTDIFVG